MHAEAFADLWPAERRKEVVKILAGISFHRGGTELTNADATRGICVFDNAAPVHEVLKHLGMGFDHVLQRERDDFAFALLSTALIKKKPKAFFASPFPFLFRSLENGLDPAAQPATAALSWTKPWDKYSIIDQILTPLAKTKARVYKDVIAANMDELLTNAKPADPEENSTVSITMAFAADRLCCAVKDNHREFSNKKLRERLWDLSLKKKWTPRPGEGGAGLGVTLMVNNSTAYYLCHSRGIGTMAAFLIDTRKGLRDLESLPKNAHIFEG